MKARVLIVFLLSIVIIKTAAQQNWAAVPCFRPLSLEAIDRMFVDSLHNEIILNSNDGYKICNITYKGLFAYNGNTFHDLDFGLNKYDTPNQGTGGYKTLGCITYGNKTLFGGYFKSVGSDTLYSKSIALWNGAVWDTFPKHCFSNKLNGSGGYFWGFTKYQNKLWMYGQFDTIGNVTTKNLVSFDGNSFSPQAIPVNMPNDIVKMIVYKNKLIAAGLFNDYPSNSISRLAMYDGSNWTTVGVGVLGSIANIYDMAIYKDTLYIAGVWSTSAGNVSNYIMKWDGTQLYDAGFGTFCGYGAIWSVVPYRNRLYAFGNFMCAANKKAFGVAYYENGKWTVPQDSIENWGIRNAVVYKDAIYIGGGFRSINGDTSINSFAKLLCPDFDAATGCLSGINKNRLNSLNLKVFPNPAKDKLNIEFDSSTSVDKISVSNTLGQEVYKLQKPESKQQIDISYLPVGIYFLKAENNWGQSMFKVVKE